MFMARLKKKVAVDSVESEDEQTTFNEDDMSVLYDDEDNVIEVEETVDLSDDEILEEE